MSIAVKRMSDGEDWDPIRLKREKRRLVQRKADRKRRRRRENPIIRERHNSSAHLSHDTNEVRRERESQGERLRRTKSDCQRKP